MIIHKLAKKIVVILSALILAACGASEKSKDVLELSQMKAIAELAVMECYYNNVAKFKEEEASGFLFWKKDKHFWIEYNGVVSLGIDASKLEMEVEDTVVKIHLPETKVLSYKVDPNSLTEEAFVVEDDSAKITAEDERIALTEAQKNMLDTATRDTALMNSARTRVKKLLEGYVQNLGDHLNIEYKIEWIDIIEDNSSTDEITPPAETP